MITVIGLGAGDLNQLALVIYKKLINTNSKIFSRTNKHPVIKELIHEDVRFNSFDDYYVEQNEFASVYLNISTKLLDLGQKRSEERRVGKDCRTRWGGSCEKKKK